VQYSVFDLLLVNFDAFLVAAEQLEDSLVKIFEELLDIAIAEDFSALQKK